MGRVAGMVALAMVAGMAPPTAAWAQGRVARPAGPTIADAGSDVYGFETFALRSADGLRGYVVTVSRPKASAPPSGYPVVYALDGGLALAALDEPLLQHLTKGSPPVIVTVAHAVEAAVNVRARAFDYTPAPEGVEPGEIADHAGRPGGGADAFLALLDGVIRPRIEARLPVDPARETLWGHSYGGLFVLHAALIRPFLFDRFVAASPSLWWNYGSVLAEERPFLAGPRPASFVLTLLVGEDEQRPPAAGAPPRHPMWTSLPPGETGRLARRLREAGVDVGYSVLAGQGHGGMLGASLRLTLIEAAALVEPLP